MHIDMIVSRHAAVRDVVADILGLSPEVRDAIPVHAAVTADMVRDRVVVGNLPANLAALTRRYIAVEFADPPRGAEADRDEMFRRGVFLAEYSVRQLRTFEPAREPARESS